MGLSVAGGLGTDVGREPLNRFCRVAFVLGVKQTVSIVFEIRTKWELTFGEVTGSDLKHGEDQQP